jgi:pilus assembly protein CpaE
MPTTQDLAGHGANQDRPAHAFLAGVLIVAGAADVAALRAADSEGRFTDATDMVLDAGQPVPAAILAHAHVLVIEVDPALPSSLQRLRTIRIEQRALPIIAALRGMDVGAVRALLQLGVADVVEMPLVPADLAERIDEIGTRSSTSAQTARLAPLVCVAGGLGGCGTTTVITHLAGLLANPGTRSVCVVDLDLQGGEVAYYVGATPRVTVMTLLEAGERIDVQFIRSALTESSAGFTLVAAPEKIAPLDEVQAEQLLRVLGLLRQMFDLVLVDLPSDWTNWGLSVASAASRIVMVTELRLACLRQVRRRLDLFYSVGIGRDRVLLVANRVESRFFKPVSLKEAAEALGQGFTCSLPDEGHDMTAAQDEGRLLGAVRPRNKFDTDLKVLADKLVGPAK